MTYMLDTNIISYFLREEGNIDKHFEKEIIQADNSYAIPLIVFFEIKRWLLDNPTRVMRIFNQQFDNLFSNSHDTAEMPVEVWEKAADIYVSLKQKGQLIGDVDIIIAAYCIVNDYVLVTRNANDFKRIDSLKLVNWFE